MSQIKITNRLKDSNSRFNEIEVGQIFVGRFGSTYIKLPDSDGVSDHKLNNHAYCFETKKIHQFGSYDMFRVVSKPQLVLENK